MCVFLSTGQLCPVLGYTRADTLRTRPGRPTAAPPPGRSNRRALIAAAREVYATTGSSAPFSAVAKRAGVGQGSLYRHFPDRTALAVAVFEENLVDLEEFTAPADRTIDDLLDRVVAQAMVSTAFIDLITADLHDPRVAPLGIRFRALSSRVCSRANAPLGHVGDARRGRRRHDGDRDAGDRARADRHRTRGSRSRAAHAHSSARRSRRADARARSPVGSEHGQVHLRHHGELGRHRRPDAGTSADRRDEQAAPHRGVHVRRRSGRRQRSPQLLDAPLGADPVPLLRQPSARASTARGSRTSCRPRAVRTGSRSPPSRPRTPPPRSDQPSG